MSTAKLFYVTHPKVPKALLGPFLTEADAQCGVAIMRSPGAMVMSVRVDHLDDIARGHAVNNGKVCRAFAGGGHRE
ncbi:hypothetical protein D3C84_754460 [compost metagenome]|jgi:hypothetical protein